MATRRAEPYQFNHAQYFKIENNEFKDFLQPLMEIKLLNHWKLIT